MLSAGYDAAKHQRLEKLLPQNLASKMPQNWQRAKELDKAKQTIYLFVSILR